MKHLTSNPAFLDYDPIGEETVLRASSTLKSRLNINDLTI